MCLRRTSETCCPALHGSRERSLFQYVVDKLLGDQIGQPEEHAGDDHEPDHDSGRLRHLTTVGPLYPLKLAPAALEESGQAWEQVGAFARGDRYGLAPLLGLL